MTELAYLNGEILPLDQLRIHPEDRGYQFADGIYEVVAAINGVPLFLQAHMERLQRSAAGISLKLGAWVKTLNTDIPRLLAASGLDQAMLYLQITRGVAPRNHSFPEKPSPTVLMTVRPLPDRSELLERGMKAITVADERWFHCDLKTIALLPNVLAKEMAHERGADEAILVRPGGRVTEASSANVFMVRAGHAETPPASPLLLSGITREVLLREALRLGFSLVEAPIDQSSLMAADEVFLTGTTVQVMPVVAIDGKPIGDGTPGPFTRRLQAAYKTLVTEEVAAGMPRV